MINRSLLKISFDISDKHEECFTCELIKGDSMGNVGAEVMRKHGNLAVTSLMIAE
jgi:hypothetical protein